MEKGKKKNSSTYKYSQVAEAIVDKIANNEWHVDEKIPPEAELCQILQVSRVTLRESLKTLSILGVLDIVQGDGTYVREVSPASIIKPMLPLLRCRRIYAEEIYASRMIVEGGCCELAAANRTQEDIEELKALLEDMQDAIALGRAQLYSEADVKFHEKINRMCGNDILIMISNLFSELIPYYVGKINQDVDAISSSMCDHMKIFDAIKDQRADFARVMMSEHLRSSLNYLLSKQD